MADQQRITQRQAEIELAAYFAREIIAELGEDRGLDIIERAWVKYGTDSMNRRLEGVPAEQRMEALGRWYRDQMASRPEVKVIEATPTRVSIEISECPPYEACRNLGMPELCQRYCDSDYEAAQAIHPKARLSRDKEIANGASYCNHTWEIES